MAVTLSGLRSAAPSAFEGNSGEKLPILLRKGTGEGRKQNYFINFASDCGKNKPGSAVRSAEVNL